MSIFGKQVLEDKGAPNQQVNLTGQNDAPGKLPARSANNLNRQPMSYDLMVFDPTAPPVDKEGFMVWYDQQTEWNEDHSYEDPDVSTPGLKTWFLDMIKHFPAMNGPYASEEINNPKVSDYCIGKSVIYVAFSWSQAKEAYQTVFFFAKQHKIGFFDLSEDSESVWMPTPEGGYKCVFNKDDKYSSLKYYPKY